MRQGRMIVNDESGGK